jgi:hypothetical protein
MKRSKNTYIYVLEQFPDFKKHRENKPFSQSLKNMKSNNRKITAQRPTSNGYAYSREEVAEMIKN